MTLSTLEANVVARTTLFLPLIFHALGCVAATVILKDCQIETTYRWGQKLHSNFACDRFCLGSMRHPPHASHHDAQADISFLFGHEDQIQPDY